MKLKTARLTPMDRDNRSVAVEPLESEYVDRRSAEEMRTKANPIGVATYVLQSRLPADMKGKLPSARQLRAVVRSVLPGGEGQ